MDIGYEKSIRRKLSPKTGEFFNDVLSNRAERGNPCYSTSSYLLILKISRLKYGKETFKRYVS